MEKKCRLAIFTPLEDDEFPMMEHLLLKEVLDIFYVRQHLDESVSDTESALAPSS